jgi:uncharacterized protein with PQ loop repeat
MLDRLLTSEALSSIYLVVNVLRVVFYVPQILAVHRCSQQGAGNSLVTWGYFALSHWTAVAYFCGSQNDPLALVISLANALAVTLLTVVLLAKQRRINPKRPINE